MESLLTRSLRSKSLRSYSRSERKLSTVKYDAGV